METNNFIFITISVSFAFIYGIMIWDIIDHIKNHKNENNKTK